MIFGNQPSQVSFPYNVFSGNGSTTSFPLSITAANTASLIVTVNSTLLNIPLYSIVGNNIVFVTAPSTGTNNITVRYLGIPASNVVTAPYRTLIEVTATAGQTTIPATYTVGFLNVYKNGLILRSNQYTATNGTSVVLASPAALNDFILIETFYISSALNAIPNASNSVQSYNIPQGITLKSPVFEGRPTGYGTLTRSLSIAGAGQTFIDFTIPTWAERVNVSFFGLSTTGVDPYGVQIGVNGVIQTTNYVSTGSRITTGLNVTTISSTNMLLTSAATSASGAYYGSAQISLVDNTANRWVMSGWLSGLDQGTGGVTLTGLPDRIRVTTLNGVNTFDSGYVNVDYE